MLIGDVALRDNSYDTPRSHSNGGLDTQARLELLDILRAFSALKVQDRVAHQLLVRDIGEPCRRRKHDVPQGHCHRIPLERMPLLRGLDWDELDAKTQDAISLLLNNFYL